MLLGADDSDLDGLGDLLEQLVGLGERGSEKCLPHAGAAVDARLAGKVRPALSKLRLRPLP